MKVLLAEDAEGMRKIIAAMLRNLGYTDIVTAENGQQALDVIDQVGVDLLVTNWNMPVLDGLQLVQRLRQNPASAGLPVVMITSRVSRKDVVQALQAGVDGYVRKPFTPQQLREQIETVFRRRALRKIQRVTAEHDPMRPEDQHPLMLISDAACTAEELELPHNRRVLRTLDDIAAGLRRLNGNADPPRVGFVTASDPARVGRLLRHLGSRVKMLLLSTRMQGGGLTLARLAAVSRRSDRSVFLVCETQEEVPERVRRGLERLGVTVYERDQLDEEALEQLAVANVVAAAGHERPSTLPTPAQIRERLETDIRTTVSLPVLPQVYHDIAALAGNPESEIQAWVDAVALDPLTSAQIVHRARSPAYGFRGEVRQADKAVILLGKSAVQEVVVSEGVRRAFQDLREDSFDIDDFWLHSVSVAIAARLFALPLEAAARTPEQQEEFAQYELSDPALATLGRLDLGRRLRLEPTHDPFVGGMMHDIGKVALVHSYPGLYPAVRAELVRQNWDVPMRLAEGTVAGGADHTLVGAILADSWRLGAQVEAVIRDHHHPDPADPFASLVALADLVVGGIAPYPHDGAYPLARLVSGVAGAPTARPPAPAATTQSAEAAPPKAPRDALAAFLPADLCARLGLSADDIVQLAQLLAPTVRKRAESLRRRA